MLKAIIAISKDGFVARHTKDKMDWLGKTDKAIFRILTISGSGLLGAGRKTIECMPSVLEGRKLVELSRKVMRVEYFALAPEFPHKEKWLIGGQEIIMNALNFEVPLIKEIHICRSDRMAFPVFNEGIRDRITPFLQKNSKFWNRTLVTKVNDVTVECWRYSYYEGN